MQVEHFLLAIPQSNQDNKKMSLDITNVSLETKVASRENHYVKW